MPNGKQKVLKCTITKKDFIDWFYFDGIEPGFNLAIYTLGKQTITGFLNKEQIKLKTVLKNCNQSIITGKYIQEFKKSLEFKNEELDFIEYKLGVKIKLKLI